MPCIFLMTNNIEHLFLYLFAIPVPSLGKYVFRSFAHFLLFILFFFSRSLSFENSLYILNREFITYMICGYFLQVSGLSFHSLNSSFEEQKYIIFMKSKEMLGFFCGHKDFLHFHLGFMFRSHPFFKINFWMWCQGYIKVPFVFIQSFWYLWKDYPISDELPLQLHWKSIDHVCVSVSTLFHLDANTTLLITIIL